MNDRFVRTDGPGRQTAPVPVASRSVAVVGQFAEGPEPHLIDLRDIWAALWRNRYLILAVIALFLAAALVVTRLSTPIYQATATVEIDSQPDKVLGTEETPPSIGVGGESERLLQTQVDIVHSRALATRVIDSLGLATNDNFLDAMGIEADAPSRRRAAVEALVKNVSAQLPQNSRVVPISFASPEPNTAAMIANSYADNLIAANLQRRFDSSTYSKNFLQKQLQITKARLEGSERSLLAYARAAGIVDTGQGAGSPDDPGADASRSLTTSNLVQLNQAYAAARSARLQAQQRWQQAQSTPIMSLPDVLSNPAIQQLTQNRAQLQAEYQQQLAHRKPDYPEVKQASARLKELDSQIAQIANSIKSSIRNEYLTAAKQEGALAGSVGQLKSATLAEQNRGIRYNILKREVDTNRQLYEGLLQRYKQVSAEAGVTANNISIVDFAEPPGEPISPNAAMNLAFGGVAGLLFALLLVLGREMFDDSVRAPDDVERRFGIPILGVVPKLPRGMSASRALREEHPAILEPYQDARASIDLTLEDGPPQSLLVTSSQKNEGKSTTALALALSSAAAGRKVLLLDADMRSPSLHSSVGVRNAPGLADALEQNVAMGQAIHRTEDPSLDVLPAGRASVSPARLLAGTGFAELLDQAKKRYDQVIIDSPPVLGLADSLQMAAVADQTVLTVGCDRANGRALKESLRRLGTAKADVLGAILIKCEPDNLLDNSYYALSSSKRDDDEDAADYENDDGAAGDTKMLIS